MNTVAAERISRTFSVGNISRTQNTPERAADRCSTASAISAPISGVSGAPAHSTSCRSGSMWWAAAIRWRTPFCRVMRPTNTAMGRDGSTPMSVRTDVESAASTGCHVWVSMPLRTTCTLSGSRRGYASHTSIRMPELTAITASAYSTAFFSTQLDTRYPPPSCSAFHGLRGSSECAVSTWGIPCSCAARWPASPVYQVCEWATDAPSAATAIRRSDDSVVIAALAPSRPGSTPWT